MHVYMLITVASNASHHVTASHSCPHPQFMVIGTTTTITKPFVPSIWGRLHEPKENYAGSGTCINFLYSFLSCNMPSLRDL